MRDGYQEKACLQRRIGPDLRVIFVDLIEDRLVGGISEATIFPGLYVMFESCAEPFGAIIESISKGLMDTFYGVSTSHEDLQHGQSQLSTLARLVKIISLVRKPSSMHADVLHRR